jgi:hypothetical protein
MKEQVKPKIKPREEEDDVKVAASDYQKADNDVDSTYKDDDWFDLDKYKKAAQVAYDFSIGKMREAGDQERKTNQQQQTFSERDEERDYKQSQKGYRF